MTLKEEKLLKALRSILDYVKETEDNCATEWCSPKPYRQAVNDIEILETTL